MIISEIFYSLQGEGLLAGVPSVFVRLAGCPLRCRWCDTKYAWDYQAGRDYTVSQIVEEVRKINCEYVVITGGEPMVTADLRCRKDLNELVKSFKGLDKHITIETAGLWYEPNLPCDLMSISPKLSNSEPNEPNAAKIHNKVKPDLAVLRELIDNFNYQLKFVVDSEKDITEILPTVKALSRADNKRVFLMPQAQTRDELLAKSLMVAELCKQTSFTFCQRLQIMLWDNQKG
jgi:7-carboxy-7-deazaguanine synthase